MNSEFAREGNDNGVASRVEDVVSRVLPIDREQVHRFTERAREIDDQARTFIRENPTTTVIVAAALGFALGRLLRR
jgi:ElaB/YqjD/DUF883 family membrane-anchored ribosome-binding protein